MTETTDLMLPWEAWCDHEIFDNVPNIASFTVVSQFPAFVAPGDDKLRQRLADRIYQETYALIRDARLARLEQIERHIEDEHVGARYSDDDHHFTVTIRPDFTMVLNRPGSSFKRFYRWYTTVMPQYHKFVAAVQAEYQALVNAREGSEIVIAPTRAQYIFRFLLFDFVKIQGKRDLKNTNLLRHALTRVPGPDGALVNLDESVLPDLGRVDLNMSRWNRTPSGAVREVYKLEAPSNRNYGALWAEFSYIGETGASEDLPREEVDFDSFFRRVDLPLNEFLQAHCLRSFLAGLTDGVSFQTSAGGLP